MTWRPWWATRRRSSSWAITCTAQTYLTRALRLSPDDPEVKTRLAMCEDINRLDTTRRGLSTSNRHRRSLELVARALRQVELCLNPLGDKLVGPPKPAPEDLRPALNEARELQGKTRQKSSDETIEANISLAEKLWRAGDGLCPGSGSSDPALQHVLEKLSR